MSKHIYHFMAYKSLLGGLAVSLVPYILSAQAEESSEGQAHYRYQDTYSLSRRVQSASALALEPMHKRGQSLVGYSLRSGDLHHIQEGSKRSSYYFASEQYLPIGKYLLGYGRVGISQDRIGGRAWSDVLRPIQSNPYISGSNVAGSYDEQTYDLVARVSSHKLGRWSVGLGLDYQLGDLSRLRDPRSRVQLLDYRLMPSVSYSIATGQAMWMGLSYQRRKEKLIGLTTEQEDPNLLYYTMTGMEHAQGFVGGYKAYWRQYTDHRWGGELGYRLSRKSVEAQIRGLYSHGREYVYEAYKAEPGHYASQALDGEASVRLLGSRLSHIIDLDYRYRHGSADEYKQKRITTRDPNSTIESVRYETILTYPKRYEHEELGLSLSYRLAWDDHASARARTYIGTRMGWSQARQLYRLADSWQSVSRLSYALEGGGQLFSRLWIEGRAGYSSALSSRLALSDATGAYATSVVMPLFDYMRMSYFDSSLQLEYQHPIAIKGVSKYFFVRGACHYRSASGGRSRTNLSISLGLYH